MLDILEKIVNLFYLTESYPTTSCRFVFVVYNYLFWKV